MKRILVVSHPGFAEGLRRLTERLDGYQVDVVTFRDDCWRGRGALGRLGLVRRYDVLHFFWGCTKLWDLLVYRLLGGVAIADHFIGTDLYNALRHSARKRLELRLCSRLASMVAVGPVIASDFAAARIAATTVYFTNTPIQKRPWTYPPHGRVLAYLPSASREFYGYALLHRLAEELPQVEFRWFPADSVTDGQLPPNVRWLPRMSRAEVLSEMEQSRVFVRMPRHDGLPNTVLEALSLGRWVVWSHAMPQVTQARGFDELKAAVASLVTRDTSNSAGEAMALAEYGEPAVVEGLRRLYQSLG